MAKEMTVSLTIVPLSGSAVVKVVKTVKVKATTTVEEVAKAAGVDLELKNIQVNGKPATEKTRVSEESQVTIMERPQGS